MTASLATLIATCDAVRDRCRADLDAMTDEDGAEWIDAYYAVVEHPCSSPADAIAKCKFVALAMDGKDMGWFEEEKVIRQIAALATTTAHPDAKLLELGRQFERAKAEALPLDAERVRLHAVYEASAEAAGVADSEAYDSKTNRRLMRECGYRAASDAFAAKHGEAVKLMKAIHRTRATTLEGVAVKLEAVTFDLYDFEIDPKGGDVAEVQLLRLCKQTRELVKQGESSCE